jgi:TfoX/Sxy family transcriptional regulator of competence genes
MATMGRMAYDEHLASRVRELIAGDPEVTEKRMFGGLAFLVAGNMAVAASGQGGLMVRVDPEATDALVAKPHVERFELEPWVKRGVAYARSLPTKR